MANLGDKVLLEGMFRMSKSKYSVTLTSNMLCYSKVSVVRSQCKEKVQISDIIGCHAKSVNSTDGAIGRSQSKRRKSACFTIFAYPFQKMFFRGSRTRHRVSITFEICSSSSMEESERTAHRWKNAINCLARGFQPSDIEGCEPPPWGKFLVLINPCSGTGKAMKIFHSQVAPMFEEADIPFKVFVTEYAGHANEEVQGMDLSEWAAVLVVSGDGVIYEVINGLMQRVDWSSAIKIPIGCVPGGSGNALSCSINYAAGEPVVQNPELHSTFVLIKHRQIPMDLVMIQTPSKQFYSFLSVTWGLFADVDFESEKYRFMGEARFSFGAFKSLVNMPAYAGTLSFLPVNGYVPKKNKTAPRPRKAGSFSGDHSSNAVITSTDNQLLDKASADTAQVCSMLNQADVSANKTWRNDEIIDSSDTPNAGENDCKSHPSSGVSASRENTASTLTDITQCSNHASASNSSTLKSENEASAHIACSNLEDQTTNEGPILSRAMTHQCEEENETGDSRNQSGEVPCPLLLPLDQPVSEDWVVIRGKFIMVCAVYQTHIGSDLLMAPFSRLSDGVIHLMFVHEGITRYRLWNLMMTFSKGEHVDSPDMEFVPVLAFRLEPEEGSRHFMIDGERLDPVPVQAQVLPGMARVLAIR